MTCHRPAALILSALLLCACQATAPPDPAGPAACAARLRAEHLPEDLLAEDLRFLDQARAAFPWCETTPAAVWLDAVAPHTCLDEDLRPWRADLFRRFAPLAKACASRREAILKVAQEAARVCNARYDTKRRAANQCAAETVESGMASCTGLSILLACAYRSVGIPARIAGVAQWGDRPGNHTWVEVWDTDGWHLIEYYPDKAGLDQGWVMPACVWQNPEIPEQRVLARSGSGTDIFRLPWDPANLSLKAEDRTAHYQKLGGGRKLPSHAPVLAVEARNAQGERVAVSFEASAGGAAVAVSETPSAHMDLNNTPRLNAVAGRTVTFRYQLPSGAQRTQSYTPTGDRQQTVVLKAE